MIPRSSIFPLAACLAITACQPATQSRPFAGRGGRNLDQPPRYGEPSRYVDPIAPQAGPMIDPNAAAAAGIDPRTIPPGANTTPPTNLPPTTPGLDQGLTVTPPTVVPIVPPGAAPTPAPAPAPAPVTPTPPAATATATTPVATPPPAPGDVPTARAVPGKPGYVYSPKDPKKIISVEGLRPGSKAKDPDTGEIFRVPYQ
jgi:hypothetical protein